MISQMKIDIKVTRRSEDDKGDFAWKAHLRIVLYQIKRILTGIV